MGRRDMRLESLRDLESHVFVLKSRVSAVRSTLLLSCMVLSTVVVVAWGIVTRPRKGGGLDFSLLSRLREWGFGSGNDEFRGFVITIVLASVPIGLTIAGMTWSARVRPKNSMLQGEWLQDVVDNVKREKTAWVILLLNAYVCGVAAVLFWLDVLLQDRMDTLLGNYSVTNVLSAFFLTTVYLFSASLPPLVKIGDGVEVSVYAQELLRLRRVAKWRYFQNISPRYNGFGRESQLKKSGVKGQFWCWGVFVLVMLASGMPGLSLWLSLSVHLSNLPTKFEGISLVFIVVGECWLWCAVGLVVHRSISWVKAPGRKVEPIEWWPTAIAAALSCAIGIPLLVFGYYMLIQEWWLSILFVLGANSILELLAWRTLRGCREFSLWRLVLFCVTVEQCKLSKTIVRPLGRVDSENYFAVADLIVPEGLVLDGKELRVRDYINEMMSFDETDGGR